MATYYIVAENKSPLGPNEINAGDTIDVDEGDIFIIMADADDDVKFESATGNSTNFSIQFNVSNSNDIKIEIKDDLNADVTIADNVLLSQTEIKADKAESITLTAGDNVTLDHYNGAKGGVDTIVLGDNFTTNNDFKTENGDDSVTVGQNFTGPEIDTGGGNDTVISQDPDVDIQNAETIVNPDGIVQGTAGNDTMSVGYADGETDEITDGDDKIAGGGGNDTITAGDGDDIIDGGAGADDIDGGLGADTIFGGAGVDTIDGGDGDDIIYGGGGESDSQQIEHLGRVAFKWSDIPDPDDGGQIDDGDELEDGTQTVSGVDIAYTFSSNDATYGTETIATAGVDGGGETVNTNSAISFDDDVTVNLDFSRTVTNVSFRINDFEVNSEQVVIRAYDGAGNPITFNVTPGANIVGSDTDAVAGDDTFSGPGSELGDESTLNSILVEIPGPVGEIEIVMTSPGSGSLTASDIYFDDPGEFPTTSGTVDADAGDIIDGGLGDDTIYAGSGADTVTGGAGADEIHGGTGADDLSGGSGADTIYGDEGDDTIDGDDGDDLIYGGAGIDTIDAGVGADTVYGGLGDDDITGGLGDDTLYGGQGDDTISGGAGADTIYGDGGDPAAATSESLNWSAAGADEADLSAGFTQNTGTMDVSVSFTDDGTNTPTYTVESTDTIYAAGGEPFDTNSSLHLWGDGNADTSTTTIDFAAASGSGMTDEVDNLQFRINDIDSASGNHQDQVTITAFDADGNPVGVTITPAGDDTVSGNTVTGGAAGDSQSDANGSALVTFDGPVSQVLIDYNNLDTGTQAIWVSDLHYDTIPDPTAGAGDDDIDAGTGDDVIHASGGTDTIDGGAGTDTYTAEEFDDGSISATIAQDGSGTVVKSATSTTDTITGVERFVADEEPGQTDSITLTGTVDRNTISDLSDGSVGFFTPDNGDPVIFFGGLGEPTINEILAGTYNPGSGVVNPTGSYSITSGEEDGAQIGNIFTENFEEITFNAVCFVRGTRIETTTGPVPVERLSVGDRVLTLDNGPQPIRWLASSPVLARGPTAPIRIAAGTLDNDDDLWVSPQHRMLLRDWRLELMFAEAECFVPAKSLVNDTTIRQVEGGVVEYFHLMFDMHEIVFAEGAPSESFHPGSVGLRTLSREARRAFETAFPGLSCDLARYGPSARTTLRSYEARLLAEDAGFIPRTAEPMRAAA